ncbi:hypothetical protein OF83DRAFT_1048810 [Amylostereum chailletii]|nr:hypothetical protein OF83DRAFT_1048810 [Amylostereum chailletii]
MVDQEEADDLLAGASPASDTHSYPPSKGINPSTRIWSTGSVPPLGHTPISASTLFSRRAAPLSLPQLDKYISSLEVPSFSVARHANNTMPSMFIPMDKLAASGRSLEDLQANSKVAPAWRNRNSILGSLVGIALGITGSSALASFYSLHSLVNTMQIFALILDTIVHRKRDNVGDKWRQLFMGTIPNILALNFGTTLEQTVVFMLIFMTLAGILLFLFHHATSPCLRYSRFEAFQEPNKRNSGWSIVIATFLLTIIYLPLSTMAVHVITWSDDLWAVTNPYINATSSPPIVAPLGPSDEYREPLDFCYTTTMKKNEINFGPLIVIMAVMILAGVSILRVFWSSTNHSLVQVTVWFPYVLRKVIKLSAPKVDPYTGQGRWRNSSDLDREYQRLLDRDKNPLSFSYHDFRRGWASYESVYLLSKLSALLIIAVIDPNNCLFRTLPQTRVLLVRQIILLVATLAFFTSQCIYAPFLDPVNNASEWMSRLNYVLTSLVALLVTLDIPGQSVIKGPILYIIYIITYGFSFYFTVINWGWAQRIVKSVDVFSPRLDISPTSPHTRHRIWQEAITTLILTSPECQIPEGHPLNFVQAPNSEYPPYLTQFKNSPGERHVENLKVLREAGSLTYNRASSLFSGPDYAWFRHILDDIQSHYVGPDCYWRDPSKSAIPGCTRFFGNAWLVPFPPTVVIKYDDGPLSVLQDVSDIREYVAQNSSDEIRRRREIRMALRALDGQKVFWPHRYIKTNDSTASWCCRGMRFKAQTSVDYESGVFSIKRKGYLVWKDLELGSGFGVTITYAKGIRADGDLIGLTDDYDLTDKLARFFALNRGTIHNRLPRITTILDEYRQHYKDDFVHKTSVLTYRFLSHVFDHPRDPETLAQSSIEFERDLRVRALMVGSERVFKISYERMVAVSTSEVATWWYIFWDDFWRRNHDTISGLKVHATDFDPHYPTSIAYTPLPRPALENFLIQRGLLNNAVKWGDFLHHGILNKIYIRLFDIVFHGSSKANIFHVGYNHSEVDMEEIDVETQARPSTLGTGNGTDHDDSYIRARPNFRWEGILNDPLTKGPKGRKKWLVKMGAWLGLTPLWRSGIPSPGVALDVRLENGKYVLL